MSGYSRFSPPALTTMRAMGGPTGSKPIATEGGTVGEGRMLVMGAASRAPARPTRRKAARRQAVDHACPTPAGASNRPPGGEFTRKYIQRAGGCFVHNP